MAVIMQAERRTNLSKGGMRKLRQSGRLPAIVFGNKLDNEMVHISGAEFQKWLNLGESGFIELQIGEEDGISVLLEDFQRDPRTRELIHIDFQQVHKNQAVRTKLAVKFNGTPAGTDVGGVVQVQSAFIEVEALPKHLPSSVEYDISSMQLGDTLQVKDIPLPSEITVISGDNDVMLSVTKP